MQDQSALTYMDTARVQRALKRMAYQVAESNRHNKRIVLLGIDQRGYIVAEHLRSYLREIYEEQFALFRVSEEESLADQPGFSAELLGDAYLLMVDDVIFSGQTMFNALNMVYDAIQFEEIHTAVLVDRGHRTFPIQAQFVGLELSTKLNEHVAVQVDGSRLQQVVLEIS